MDRGDSWLEDDLPFDGPDVDLGGDPPPPAEVPEPPRPEPEEHPLGRSPWFVVPLGVSLVVGAERLLMLSFIPGWRAEFLAVFGALFVVTCTALLMAGGLYIARYRNP